MTPPIQVTTRPGRLSDVRSRRDWSEVHEQVDALKEGDMVVMECPAGVAINRFRTVVLISGARRHAGKWRLSTRTVKTAQGKTALQCFLVKR